MELQVEKAAKILANGGIVIFPTDTAIGIGCRIDDEKAIRRLFRIRKRPENKPLLVLVNSVKMAKDYLHPIPKKVVNKLIEPYWPGKLTIILKCNRGKVRIPVCDERSTLGVRFPDSRFLQELIKKVGVPIVAPSANFSGEKTPFNFKDLDPEFIKNADFVINKGIGYRKEVSTIIDCTVNPWKILRQGAVKIFNF